MLILKGISLTSANSFRACFKRLLTESLCIKQYSSKCARLVVFTLKCSVVNFGNGILMLNFLKKLYEFTELLICELWISKKKLSDLRTKVLFLFCFFLESIEGILWQSLKSADLRHPHTYLKDSVHWNKTNLTRG